MNNIKEKKELKQSDQRVLLKEANKIYTECISKDFLVRFLSGEKVNVDDFCVAEREKMKSLDESIYGKLTFWNYKLLAIKS